MELMVGEDWKIEGMLLWPGLMDAKVEYYKSGALSKATVNMKCFTRNQLAHDGCSIYETWL